MLRIGTTVRISQIRLSFAVIVILSLFCQRIIFSQNKYSLAPQDTIELIRYPEHLNIQMTISLDKENIWYITENHRLYKWIGNQIEDLSLPGETYDYIFAASPLDIWVHVYQKEKQRYFFKRFQGDRVQEYPDPDSFPLIYIWINNQDDIWACGIVGTLLHFDGGKWNRYPGLTNNHIITVCIDGDKNGWVVVENGKGNCDLYSTSLQSKQSKNIQYVKKLVSKFSLLSTGIWEIERDSLIFSTKKNKRYSYSFSTKFEPINVIPAQKDIVYNSRHNSIWIGRKKNQPMFLLLIDSENTALQLTGDGQIKNLAVTVTKEKDLTQFHRGGLNRANEYTAGTGLLNEDLNLDIYTILQEDKNRLLLGEIESKTNNFKLKDHTIKFNAAENQLTGKNETFYDNGILIADLNNDGDEDLFITAHQGSNLYFENQNHRSFEDKTTFAGLYNDEARQRWNMAIAGDVDNDGDLDLFVTREYTSNVLYLNNGLGQFKEVTNEANLKSPRGGMGCSFADIDSDGDLDIFVANWRAKNRLYRNDGINGNNQIPMFTDISNSAAVALDDTKRSTSATFGDVDNDGDLDLFVVNRTAPNRLYLNDGHGYYKDISVQSGIDKENRICKGAIFFDADNDGDLDLAVSCKGQNLFYRNHGNLQFRDESSTCGFVEQGNIGAVICGDFDNDGDIDLYATSKDKKSSIYVNLQNDNRFIKLRLLGYSSNRDAVGAKVFFYEGGHSDNPDYLLGLRTLEAGGGMASTNSKIVHFGTGKFKSIDCKIIFPSGIIIRKNNLKPGTYLKIEELSGRQKYWILFKRKLTILPRQSDFRVETFAYFGFALCLFLLFPYIKRKKWKAAAWHYALPFMVVFIMRISLHHQTLKYRLGIPLAFGAFSFVLIVQFLLQKYQQQQREELTENLWRELIQFQHGDWARSNLNQLLFFAQNINDENQKDAYLRKKLLENINTYIRLTNASLLNIGRLGKSNPEFKNLSETITRAAANIYRTVETIKNNIQIGESLVIKKFNQMAVEILTLKSSLDALSVQVEQKYECEIKDFLVTVHSSFDNYEPLRIHWDVDSIPQVKTRIRAAELIPVIDNLIQNAQTATRNQKTAELTISGCRKDNRLYLHFRDNGTGIPKNKQKEIFKPGYSTGDKKNSGQGLAFSKQIMKKYGGDIYLKRSSAKGTEFVVELVVLSSS